MNCVSKTPFEYLKGIDLFALFISPQILAKGHKKCNALFAKKLNVGSTNIGKVEYVTFIILHTNVLTDTKRNIQIVINKKGICFYLTANS